MLINRVDENYIRITDAENGVRMEVPLKENEALQVKNGDVLSAIINFYEPRKIEGVVK